MKILIAGGTGFVGKNLIRHWQDKHEMYVVGRNTDKVEKNFPTCHCVNWDKLNNLDPENFDVVINLAGETINHLFWTKAVKQKIVQSRIESTLSLVSWINHKPSAHLHFLNASALSIYGLYENIPLNLSTEAAHITEHPEFLSQVAFTWEEAVSRLFHTIPVSILRFAIILGKDGGALPTLSLAAKLGLATRLGKGEQPFAWIAIEDVVRGIDWIIQEKITGPINMVTSVIPTQNQFTKTLCQNFSRPYFFGCPAGLLRFTLGQMANEMLLKGQAAQPKVLLESGFTFSYSDLENYLTSINHKPDFSL